MPTNLQNKLRETALGTLVRYLMNRPHPPTPKRMARHILDAAERAYHESMLPQKKEALIKELAALIPEKNELKILSLIQSQFKSRR